MVLLWLLRGSRATTSIARTGRPPDSGDNVAVPVTNLTTARIRRRMVLGGLIHEYQRAA